MSRQIGQCAVAAAFACLIVLSISSPAFALGKAVPAPQAVKTVMGPWIAKFEPPGVVVMANRGKAEATGVGRRLLITLAGGTPAVEPHPPEEDAE